MSDSDVASSSFSSFFSDARFWSKAKELVKTAARELLEKALWLFYVLKKPDVPAWARAVILGALAYLIAPLDLIPDFIPITGLMDDASTLAAAVAAVAMYIDEDVKTKTKQKLQDWGL